MCEAGIFFKECLHLSVVFRLFSFPPFLFVGNCECVRLCPEEILEGIFWQLGFEFHPVITFLLKGAKSLTSYIIRCIF